MKERFGPTHDSGQLMLVFKNYKLEVGQALQGFCTKLIVQTT